MSDDLERYLYHSHQGWPVYETQTPSSLTGEAMTHDPRCIESGESRCMCDAIRIIEALDGLTVAPPLMELPLHRTEAGWPNCSTCDGGGCHDCTEPA